MVESRRKSIAFYTEGPPFSGDTLSTQALGGSETALIQAARALADLGNEVTVFNHCPTPGLFDGVQYLPRTEFIARTRHRMVDVLIVSRFFGVFAVPVPAAFKVLWNHDTLDSPRDLRTVLPNIDLLFTLSQFHRDHYLTRIPQAMDRIFVTRNGIDLDRLDRATRGAVRDPRKVLYASRPERGLQPLLESIWPRLVSRRPDLRLYLCGYEVARSDLAPGLFEHYQHLERLIDASPNVVRLGSLPKNEYYRHLAEAVAMLYPCTFPEISCIAAIEAQACGTPILTTDAFALAETVPTKEFRVVGRPGTDVYDRAYVERALRILGEPEEALRRAEPARTLMRNRYTWRSIVSEWNRLFDLALASKMKPADSRRVEIRQDDGPVV